MCGRRVNGRIRKKVAKATFLLWEMLFRMNNPEFDKVDSISYNTHCLGRHTILKGTKISVRIGARGGFVYKEYARCFQRKK